MGRGKLCDWVLKKQTNAQCNQDSADAEDNDEDEWPATSPGVARRIQSAILLHEICVSELSIVAYDVAHEDAGHSKLN